MITYNKLTTEQKLACSSLFPEQSKKDEYWFIRLQAYRALGYTEEALNDSESDIRREAEIYFEIKKQLEKTTQKETIQIDGKMYKLTEIIK